MWEGTNGGLPWVQPVTGGGGGGREREGRRQGAAGRAFAGRVSRNCVRRGEERMLK